MDIPDSRAVPSSGDPAYHVAGEPGMVYTRFQLRDRIRQLEILPETEIAPQGTDHYQSAAQFPELGSYFSIVSQQQVAASPLVKAGPPPEAVVNRLVPAIAYPFQGVGAIFILVAAALQVIPVVGLIAGAVIGVYGLAIARASSRGLREMPSLAEMGGPVEIIVSFLKLVAIGFVGGLLPVIGVVFLPIPFAQKPLVIFAILALYLPASMLTLARTNSLSLALSPSYLTNLIGTLGADYFAALSGFLIVLAASIAAALLPQTLALVLTAFISVWAGFYVMHLLGWAIWRHADELA